MGLAAFRVTRRTEWNGWQFAPPAGKHGSPDMDEYWDQLKADLTLSDKERATAMKRAGCTDERACNPAVYAGDIVLVAEGDQRLGPMVEMTRRFIYDAAIPPVSELLKDESYKRLTQAPAAA